MIKNLHEIFNFRPRASEHSTNYAKRLLRVGVDTLRGFIEDDCYSKASALTFYSLLSIVPLFAVLFGIAKGFGFEKTLERLVIEQFYEQEELTNRLIEFAYSWLQSVQGGIIAGIGTILLFWTVLGLLNNTEAALNSIWKTKASRSMTRKLSDYLAAMIVCPIFIVTLSSVNVYVTTQIAETAPHNVVIEVLSPYVLYVLKLFPFFLSWLLFTFVYLYMPNTKVYLRSAIVAGIISGTAFQIWQWIYIRFQIGLSSYGAVYGSFAAVPLFLIWLQMSWLIFLSGAELAFEIENDLFIPVRKQAALSVKAVALFITYRCIETFTKGQPPLSDRNLAQELGISLNHVHALVEALQDQQILATVSLGDKTSGYQPARAAHTITMKSVSDAIERSNLLMASYNASDEMQKIVTYLSDVDQILEDPTCNPLLYP